MGEGLPEESVVALGLLIIAVFLTQNVKVLDGELVVLLEDVCNLLHVSSFFVGVSMNKSHNLGPNCEVSLGLLVLGL